MLVFVWEWRQVFSWLCSSVLVSVSRQETFLEHGGLRTEHFDGLATESLWVLELLDKHDFLVFKLADPGLSFLHLFEMVIGFWKAHSLRLQVVIPLWLLNLVDCTIELGVDALRSWSELLVFYRLLTNQIPQVHRNSLDHSIPLLLVFWHPFFAWLLNFCPRSLSVKSVLLDLISDTLSVLIFKAFFAQNIVLFALNDRVSEFRLLFSALDLFHKTFLIHLKLVDAVLNQLFFEQFLLGFKLLSKLTGGFKLGNFVQSLRLG